MATQLPAAQVRGGGRTLAHEADPSEDHRGEPGGVHRHSPRAVPAKDGNGEQGERGFAAEDHRCPGDADRIGAAQPLHQDGAAGHHQGGGHQGRARSRSFEQRPDHGQQRGDAGHRHAEDGRFGVPGPRHQGDVEQHQAIRGDTGQPQPFRAARHDQPSAGQPRHDDEDQAGDGVPERRQLAGVPGLVLGYAAHAPDQLREAAQRIARVVSSMDRPGSSPRRHGPHRRGDASGRPSAAG